MTLVSTLPAFTKRIMRASVRRSGRLLKKLGLPKKRLLFAYGGRTSYWPGMGRELYEHEPVFRASIRETSRLVREMAGHDILPNFEGPLDPDFFADGTKISHCLMSLQLALTDLWTARGIVPNAVMGVSLGEITAVYAAGGLTRADAVRIITAGVLAEQRGQQAYLMVYLPVGLEEARILCQQCPVMLAVVSQPGPTSVICFCQGVDQATVTAFLAANNVGCEFPYPNLAIPFHTYEYAAYYEFTAPYLLALRPQPLMLDFYSATGELIPKGSIIPNTFWHDMMCMPSLVYATLQRVATDNFRLITHVGSHPFLTGRIQQQSFNALDTFDVVDSMRNRAPELNLFRQTHRKLRRATWPNVLARRWSRPADIDPYRHFVQGLNLHTPESIGSAPEICAYLRRQGPVHYLPVHHEWLVCSYADANHILQHPDLFSSKTHQDFDALLLGADPPDHTVVRALMQPLFTAQSLAELSTYTRQKLGDSLQQLATRDQFDVVADLAIPLVQSASAFFIGLSPREDQELHASLNGHLYSLAYLDNLKAFFRAYLKRPAPGRIGQLLLTYVQAGQLSVDGAVDLMRLLWVAGTLTTSALLSSLLNDLARQPHLAERLRRHPELIPKFVEEGLRIEPSEMIAWRITTQATTLAETHLPAGSVIGLSLLGANRDPQAFVNPDDYNLDRPARRVLTFGGGVHHCIGAGIARAQAQLVVRMVLDAFPDLRLSQPGPPRYYTPASRRALIDLWVRTS